MSTRTQPLAGARAASRDRAAWLVLAVLLLFSIAAPLNQFKVPPIMPLLMDALQLSAGRAGLLMSVFAITGLILALPSGLIFQKAGYRVTGLIAGGSIVFGAVLGARQHEPWRLAGEPGDRRHRHKLHGRSGPGNHRPVVCSAEAWHGDGHLVGLGAGRLIADAVRGADPGPGRRLA